MNKPKARKNDIVIQKVKNETLVYDLKVNKAHCLNETSALIWEMCDGTRGFEEIANKMSLATNSSVSEELVMFACAELQAGNLIEKHDRISASFSGMSRREVIRKVGISSAIALPIIATLAAPSALNAQSCRATGNPGGFFDCIGTGTNCVPFSPTLTICDNTQCCSGKCAQDPANPIGNCAAS